MWGEGKEPVLFIQIDVEFKLQLFPSQVASLNFDFIIVKWANTEGNCQLNELY